MGSWKIERIWSTDWFKNPEAQLIPIIRKLDELKTIKVKSEDCEEIDPFELEDDSQLNILDPQPIADLGQLLKEETSLKDMLITFNETVIVVENPTTPESERLLRPQMVDSLLKNLPCTKSDFLSDIPEFLRTKINATEGKYLPRVLEIITENS